MLLIGVLPIMKTKSTYLGIALFTLTGLVYAQEFVIVQPQSTTPPPCQENCSQEGQSSAQNMQIDRSGMDKASVHLQILQQASPRFTESSGSNSKKPSVEDKKSSAKTQENN